MLNDVSNSSLAQANLLSSSLTNSSSVTNALKSNTSSTTTSSADLLDEGKISKEALAKYEQEQEITYYKSLLNQMLGSDDSTSSSDATSDIQKIIDQVKSGSYNVDNSTLAKSILSDSSATSLLG